MTGFKPSAVTLALLTLAAVASAQTTPATTELGRITVTGEGDKLGTGLMVDEEAAKAKSTVTKAQLEKMRPTSNPFQALTLLPGVNTTSTDATGLFGGTLRVRGFNSDQMGFTVNGAPVNDSGNFAVFPQEYVDIENLCELYLTQGATDTEAPHVGASGGNVGLSNCGPLETARWRYSTSLGQLDFRRNYLRADTGRIGDFKGFLSVSKAEVDKWRGLGGADRLHIDGGAEYQIGNASLSASLLYNTAINNNFAGATLAQYEAGGYDQDYSLRPPQHKPPSPGTADNDNSPTQATYYGYALNPFENYLLSGKASIPLTPSLRWDIEPYFWYGYGTGGTQQNTLAESSGGDRLGGGIPDLNADGDTLDTVLVYRGSVTNTHRPGLTSRVSFTLPGHRLMAGLWYERARHRQTAPATTIENAGRAADIWLSDPALLVRRLDGSLYQNRNWLTISTGRSVFLQDTMDLLDNRLTLVPGVSWREITRDFTNFANEGTNQGATYSVQQQYSKLLPSLGATFKANPAWQVFAGASKNMRVPSNFELSGGVASVTYTGGVPTASTLAITNRVKEETAWNFDSGVRFKGSMFRSSATVFYTRFKDRIARSYDPYQAMTVDMNVGDSATKGLELEFGTVPWRGFSLYASGTYTRSTIKNDLALTATTFAPTAGKQFPDTPKGMAALALQWAQGPYLVNLSGKYTSPRAVSLTNDQVLGGYTIIDLNAAYKLPNFFVLKAPTFRFNVSNLFDKRYYYGNLGSGSNIVTFSTPTSPIIANGAPRFSSVTFQADY